MSFLSKGGVCLGLAVALFSLGSASAPARAGVCEMSDGEIHDLMEASNAYLATTELGISIEQVECFTIGQGRPAVRIHQLPFRWVPFDSRRNAIFDNLTYIVDQSGAGTSSGVSAVAAEAAIDRAMTTWDAAGCLADVPVLKNPDPGTDITIFDFLIGAGDEGFPFLGDTVHAGWFGEPFFGPDTLGFSVTFVFRDPDGVPTDVNGDNRLDTAANEVYFNDAFDWAIDAALPQIDVESVALHESGHSLGIGHFGPPPSAVMNPVYTGLLQQLLPIDEAGMCTVFGSWPNP